MTHSRKLERYQIEYIERPYGKKSPMLSRRYWLATSKKDADEWVKVLKKDKDFVRIVEVKKVNI